MSDFQQVLDQIETRRQNQWNAIPTFFERLSPYFPGIQKAIYTLITASSGVGKSKLTRELFIYGPLRFLKAHPECPLTYRPFYFSLEETREEFILNGILGELSSRYGVELDLMTLQGVGVNRHRLTPEVMGMIASLRDYFEEFLTQVTFVDNVRNPTGIFFYMREYAWRNGTFFYKGVQVTDPKGSWDKYVPHDPNQIVNVIVDHLSLLQVEKREDKLMNLMETMEHFSNHYAIALRNKLGMSITVVQQQSADKERVESTYKGTTIEAKLEPSLDGLGDSKKTQRDANYVLGLFAPNRYDIKVHRNYDITLLQDTYRSLTVLKARSAPSGAKISLWMNGATNEFRELPPAADMNDLLTGDPDPDKYRPYLPRKV